MSEANPVSQRLVTELQVSAHLMQLDAGVYCVYHSPGSAPPDAHDRAAGRPRVAPAWQDFTGCHDHGLS